MWSLAQLAELAARHGEDLNHPVREFAIGGRHFDFNRRPRLMGVINLSPDSWYRESVCPDLPSATRRLHVLAAQGADIIDIGAESTLPHAARTEAGAQKSLVLPLIREAAAAGIITSLETYLPAVARAGLEAGAKVLNLTRGTNNRRFFELARDHDAAVILCYVQGRHARDVSELLFRGDPIDTLYEHFARQAEVAKRCGLEKLIIDPGLGFYYSNLLDGAERVRHQTMIFLNTFRLRRLGLPICHALPHAFEQFGEEVRSAEPFFAVLASLGQTSLFRTHEIPKVRAVLETLECAASPAKPPDKRKRPPRRPR